MGVRVGRDLLAALRDDVAHPPLLGQLILPEGIALRPSGWVYRAHQPEQERWKVSILKSIKVFYGIS